MSQPNSSELQVPLLQDAVLASLRDRLLDGTFPPGSQLNIREVAALFGVSAVPVREAIKTLQSEGRLVHERDRGYTVRRMSHDELVQVDRLATLVEVEMIAAGVPALNPTQIGTMREMAKIVTGGQGGTREVLEAHRRLHFIPYEAANLNIYMDVVTRLWAHYEPYRLLFFGSDLAHRSSSSDEHRRFVEACASGDTKLAMAIHRGHRLNSFGHLIRIAQGTLQEEV
jgi:DNA-binding GntR family transcriptional regulator